MRLATISTLALTVTLASPALCASKPKATPVPAKTAVPAAPAKTPAPAATAAPAAPAATAVPAAAAAPAAPAVPGEVTVASSANPELVGLLTKQLGVTPKQAEGGAGALFGVAKSALKTDEYASVAKAVPGIDGLIKSAPPADTSTTAGSLGAMASGLGGSVGKAGGVALATGAFAKLGLKGDMVQAFVPIVVDYAGSKGGDAVGKLLGGVLK